MKVLENIIQESGQYYRDIKGKLERQILVLPKGSVKMRKIAGRPYYYHQYRDGEKVVHKYLGKARPEELIQQIKKRKSSQEELKKVKEALKIIQRSKGRRRDKSR